LATLKLHYDGWLALPDNFRHMLGLKTGDRLQAELVDGTIVLRPTPAKRVPAAPEPVAEIPGVVAVAAVDSMAAPVKRPRGRPRKMQVDPSHVELLPGLARFSSRRCCHASDDNSRAAAVCEMPTCKLPEISEINIFLWRDGEFLGSVRRCPCVCPDGSRRGDSESAKPN